MGFCDWGAGAALAGVVQALAQNRQGAVDERPLLRGGVVAPVDLHAEPGLGGGSRHVQAVAAAARDLGPDRPERVREAVRPGPALVADRVARPLVDRRAAGGPAGDVQAQAAGLVQEPVAGAADGQRRPVLGLDAGAGLLDDGGPGPAGFKPSELPPVLDRLLKDQPRK